jgi:hypothetical protein
MIRMTRQSKIMATSRICSSLPENFSKEADTGREKVATPQKARLESPCTLFDLRDEDYTYRQGCDNYLAYLEAHIYRVELWNPFSHS